MNRRNFIGVPGLTLTGILLFSSCRLFGQDHVWPPKSWADSGLVRIHTGMGSPWPCRNLRGQINLKNGDSLKDCCIRMSTKFCFVLVSGEFKQKKIYNSDILEIKATLQEAVENYMEFRPVYENFMWRLVRQKDNAAIYDRPYEIDYGKSTDMILICEGDSITRIFGTLGYPTPIDRKKQLVKFINKYFHRSFKEEDFKTEMDTIDYVLDHTKK